MNEYIDLFWQTTDSMGYRLDWKELILGVVTPIFMVVLLIERYISKKQGRFVAWQEIITNLSLGFSYQAVEVVVHFLFVGALLHWIHQFRLFDFEVTAPLFVIGFFAMEFLYYWYHRANHRIRYMWCSHVVHHSSENMNISTATRQSMTYGPSGGIIVFFAPLMLIGFPPEVVMSMYAMDLLYQYFIHTQVVDKLHPAIEYIFNTPSHHRAHHGKNEEYIDMNYGGVVIIFDRMFGTFVEEDSENNPVEYGIPERFISNNILAINFHEWKAMIKDMSAPGSLWQKVKHLWAPPEWKR